MYNQFVYLHRIVKKLSDLATLPVKEKYKKGPS